MSSPSPEVRERRDRHLLGLSRRAGLPDGLAFELFGAKGSAAFDLHRAGEFQISTDDVRSDVGGPRRVLIGPEHPYLRGGLPDATRRVWTQLVSHRQSAAEIRVLGPDQHSPRTTDVAADVVGRDLEFTCAVQIECAAEPLAPNSSKARPSGRLCATREAE